MSAVLQSSELSSLDPEARFNIYTIVHKGLRGFMSDVMNRLGRMDVNDDCERTDAIQQLRALLVMCRAHLQHENEFVHPAIEKVRPGFTQQLASEHIDHVHEIDSLGAAVDALEAAQPAVRTALAQCLYRDLSRFVGENFVHMVEEETANHSALIDAYSDDEILAIEHAIVASLSPEESFAGLRWMIPQINAMERAFLLGGMKRNAPPEVFKLVLDLAREALSQRDYYKLEKALA